MKPKLTRLILLALICLPIAARQRTFGWCEEGGKTVSVPGNTPSTTLVQRSFPNCLVAVYLSGTLNLATLYADNNGTIKANPFSADSNAYWFFYSDSGTYDVNFSGAGISTPFTLGDWTVGLGGFDGSSSFGALPFPAQSPGSALTGGVNNLITMTPCPAGAYGSVTFPHWLWFSGGTGTSEPGRITGGTCTPGAQAGTLVISGLLSNHSGAWTVQSATSGLSEAASQALYLGGGTVTPACGTYSLYSVLTIPTLVNLNGSGWCTVIQIAANQWPDFANDNPPNSWSCGGSGGCLITTIPNGSGIVMSNFVLDGNGSNKLYDSVGTGVGLQSCYNCQIDTVKVQNMKIPGRMIGVLSNTGNGNVVSNSFTHGYGGTVGTCAGGIFFQTPGTTVVNNTVDNICDEGIIASSPGDFMNTIANNEIIGNNAAYPDENMFHVENAAYVTLTGNRARGWGAGAYSLAGIAGYGPSISPSTTIISSSIAGPDAAGHRPTYGVVMGNDQGIPPHQNSVVNITGNIFDTNGSGIACPLGCDNVTVQNNIIKNNPQAAIFVDNRNTNILFMNNILLNNVTDVIMMHGPILDVGSIVVSPNVSTNASTNRAVFNQKMGSPVASASTIIPTGNFFSVTGTATITRIEWFGPEYTGVTPHLPFLMAGTELTIVPAGAFSFASGGNIINNVTATINVPCRVSYRGDGFWVASCPTQ